MSTETLCVLIATLGTVLSTLVSFLVSRYTANKEIEKMRLSWDREDSASADKAFSQMIHAVRDYTSCENEYFKYDAMNAVDALRLTASDSVNAVLSQLHDALRHGNRNLAESLLSQAVQAKKNDNCTKVAAQRRCRKH